MNQLREEAEKECRRKVAAIYAQGYRDDQFPDWARKEILRETEQEHSNSIYTEPTQDSEWEFRIRSMLERAEKDTDPAAPDLGYAIVQPGDFPDPINVNYYRNLKDVVATAFLIKCTHHSCDHEFCGHHPHAPIIADRQRYVVIGTDVAQEERTHLWSCPQCGTAHRRVIAHP